MDPQIVDESTTPNPTLVKNNSLLGQIKKEEFESDFPFTSTKGRNFNHLSTFWKRLIFKPGRLAQTPGSSISDILEEETNISATNFIRTVLSKNLHLPNESPKISMALEKCNKIFHEDYPFDFILVLDGKRLGMILLDKCYDSENEVRFVYRFNPDLKSFKGLF